MEPFDRPPRPSPTAYDAGELDDDFDYGPRHREPSGQRRRPRRRNPLWRWRRVLFLLGLLGMAGVAGGVALIAQVELPELEDLQQSSFICAADVPPEQCNSRRDFAQISAEEDRENVKLEDVPPVVVDAIVATEDRDFFDHQGIDPVGIGRALYRDIRGGGLAQGGSTITQQFVKNRLLSSERSLTRKIKEALMAIKVEQEMSKTEILEGYLNSIYWGRNAYGIQAASRAYFDKDVKDLQLEQASYLAGLIRAPELAEVDRHPEEAERRRQTVLDAMLETRKISREQHDLVERMPLADYVIDRQSYRLYRTNGDVANVGGEYITAYVEDQYKRALRGEGYTDEEIARGGFRIYTTIDINLQREAFNAVYGTLTQVPGPDGSLVALDEAGRIKAMVGGRNFAESNNNLAIAGRQVGSTFKAIALAAAIQGGYSMTETQLPAPGTITIQPPEGSACDPWEVSNYDEEAGGEGYFDLVQATQHSSNTAYGRLMSELMGQLGPESVKDMAAKLGMDSELGDCLPTVLGADNSTALEMAEVYSTFANRGMHREPKIIERIEQVDQDGNIELVYARQTTEERAMEEEDADRVTHALRSVIDGGTGEGANIGKQAAGKTGTTQNCKDAWFVGYVPKLTVSVWMGHREANAPVIDDETNQPKIDPETGQPMLQIPPMRDIYGKSCVTGGSVPAQIWQKFMSAAAANLNDNFPEVNQEQLQAGEPLTDDVYVPSSTTTLPGQGPWPTGPGGGSGPTFTLPTVPGTDPTDTPPSSGGSTTSSTVLPDPSWPPDG